MERSAKNHTRSCVHAKAAQLILGAKLLRNCASEIDREAIKIAKAADGGSDAPVRSVESRTMGEVSADPDASHVWAAAQGAQLQDQDP
jgi:hypothetical protein